MSAPQVYVQLIGEAVDCWRPVPSKELHTGVFEILGIVPTGEQWEFGPGARVRCREQAFSDGKRGLVAYESAAL